MTTSLASRRDGRRTPSQTGPRRRGRGSVASRGGNPGAWPLWRTKHTTYVWTPLAAGMAVRVRYRSRELAWQGLQAIGMTLYTHPVGWLDRTSSGSMKCSLRRPGASPRRRSKLISIPSNPSNEPGGSRDGVRTRASRGSSACVRVMTSLPPPSWPRTAHRRAEPARSGHSGSKGDSNGGRNTLLT